jgi:hypothetical protein
VRDIQEERRHEERKMDRLIPTFTVAKTTGTEDLVHQQNRAWQPTSSAVQTPLWPEGVAIAPPATPGNEVFGTSKEHIAGRPITMVEHVSVPTMTIYRPTGKNTGAAVLVFPGGGYRVLAIDLEGTEVCDWLTAKGITCVVLKYRVPGSGPYWTDECNCARTPSSSKPRTILRTISGNHLLTTSHLSRRKSP